VWVVVDEVDAVVAFGQPAHQTMEYANDVV